MRRFVFVLAVVIVLASCGEDERFLPPGDYAGSTSLDQPYRISITDEPKVNGEDAEWDERGKIKLEKQPGKPVISCISQADGEELRCEIPRAAEQGGGVETIELVRE